MRKVEYAPSASSNSNDERKTLMFTSAGAAADFLNRNSKRRQIACEDKNRNELLLIEMRVSRETARQERRDHATTNRLIAHRLRDYFDDPKVYQRFGAKVIFQPDRDKFVDTGRIERAIVSVSADKARRFALQLPKIARRLGIAREASCTPLVEIVLASNLMKAPH